MADINIILDEELDYEGEEPPKSNEDEISLEDEGEFGDESFQDKTIPDKKTEEVGFFFSVSHFLVKKIH
uniref:Uncharacterized protein n=1 Tax=Panagrolaimus sp. JU765 TaxID=591449 RepID=A0AC34QN34_9BILA